MTGPGRGVYRKGGARGAGGRSSGAYVGSGTLGERGGGRGVSPNSDARSCGRIRFQGSANVRAHIGKCSGHRLGCRGHAEESSGAQTFAHIEGGRGCPDSTAQYLVGGG